MKKNTFINGAMVATLGIVISKIIGIVYVIPFYKIIGEQGGALYGYSYTIYSIFLTLSVVGIPFAMSKIVSEYIVTDKLYTKEKVFKLGLLVVSILGVLSFILLFFLSPVIANTIVGGITGGNTVNDVIFVLRVISIAILIVPALSVTRGYLQGHKFITPTSISQVVEQVVRVTVILVGSYLSMKVFNLGLTKTVGIAVLAATIGALFSFLYLWYKIKRNEKELNRKASITREEIKITTKFLLKKIVTYALPFIAIDIIKESYNLVDALVVVKTMVNNLGYSITEAETTMAVISTWGNKLNMIVVALSSGLIVSLLPNITSNFVSKKMDQVENKVNQAYQILLYITIPLIITLSIFAPVVWNIFYGISEVAVKVFSYYIWSSLFLILFTISITILQCFNHYKMVFISLISGFMVNAILNIPLMIAVTKMGLDSYFGNITASMLGYLVSTIICLVLMLKKYKFNMKDTFNKLINIIYSSIIYAVILLILNYFFPINLNNKLISIIFLGIYTLIGLTIYFILTYKTVFKTTIKNHIKVNKKTNKNINID